MARLPRPETQKGLYPLVFHRNGRRIGDYYTAWDNACEKAGCTGRLMHDFRRTATRNLRRAGVEETVKSLATGRAKSSAAATSRQRPTCAMHSANSANTSRVK